jgi:hypothetical protein
MAILCGRDWSWWVVIWLLLDHHGAVDHYLSGLGGSPLQLPQDDIRRADPVALFVLVCSAICWSLGVAPQCCYLGRMVRCCDWIGCVIDLIHLGYLFQHGDNMNIIILINHLRQQPLLWNLAQSELRLQIWCVPHT